MSDAVTGFIGAALMIAFLLLIAVKLNELALRMSHQKKPTQNPIAKGAVSRNSASGL